MEWWENGRLGARKPHREATVGIQVGVGNGRTGLVAVGMEKHGHV